MKKTKKIKETRCTCKACGHIWHYGKSDIAENASTAMVELNKTLTCCTIGCWPLLLLRKMFMYCTTGCRPLLLLLAQGFVMPTKCPKCQSKAFLEEEIVHEVEIIDVEKNN